MKKKCYMDNQIDIFAYQQTQLRRKERELKKKNKQNDDIPFRYILFRKAYLILKCKGVIVRSDILEGQTIVSDEVYESLYLRTLRQILKYCRRSLKNNDFDEVLSDMYGKEYDCMMKQRNRDYVDTA